MALTYSAFTCFDEVVSHYNNTTPMRGEASAGKDIRPIGDRARKYERIVKISRNCYALSDGYHMGDEHFSVWQWHVHTASASADMEKYAPIVWRKRRDGTEEVTLRNGFGDYSHNGRYAFLHRHTPKGMRFRNRNGKHFIQNMYHALLPHRGGTDHYLAKTRTAPHDVYDRIKKAAAATPANHWQKKHAAWVTAHDDNSAVTFRKNENGGWDHVEGTGKDISSIKNPTVNKAVKAKYKEEIKSFFEWGMTMSPLLPLEDEQYKSQQIRDLRVYFEDNKNDLYYPSPPKPVEIRGVLKNEDHPVRLALWVTFAADCTDKDWGFNREYYTKTIETKEDLQRVRSRYNTWVNKTLGFMTKKGN